MDDLIFGQRDNAYDKTNFKLGVRRVGNAVDMLDRFRVSGSDDPHGTSWSAAAVVQ
jgi:hypothetical protein